jgi:hypothetical protein
MSEIDFLPILIPFSSDAVLFNVLILIEVKH